MEGRLPACGSASRHVEATTNTDRPTSTEARRGNRRRGASRPRGEPGAQVQARSGSICSDRASASARARRAERRRQKLADVGRQSLGILLLRFKSVVGSCKSSGNGSGYASVGRTAHRPAVRLAGCRLILHAIAGAAKLRKLRPSNLLTALATSRQSMADLNSP